MTKRLSTIADIDTLLGALRDARRQLASCADDAHQVEVYADLVERLKSETAESRLMKMIVGHQRSVN